MSLSQWRATPLSSSSARLPSRFCARPWSPIGLRGPEERLRCFFSSTHSFISSALGVRRLPRHGCVPSVPRMGVRSKCAARSKREPRELRSKRADCGALADAPRGSRRHRALRGWGSRTPRASAPARARRGWDAVAVSVSIARACARGKKEPCGNRRAIWEGTWTRGGKTRGVLQPSGCRT